MRFASFEYWPNQKVIKAYGLSYAFCPNHAYEFEYNRSRLIIDTRFFNQPVAFEKTAAGFIRDTILDLKKVYHDVDLITFNNKTRFEIDKVSKPESILNDVAIYKIQYDSGIHHYVFFKMLKNTFIDYNNEFFSKIKRLYINQDTSALRVNHLYINHDVQVYHDYHNKINADNGFGIYFPTRTLNINKILNTYCANPIGNIIKQIIATPEDIIANKYENPIASRNIYTLNKYENINTWRENPIVNIIRKLIITPEPDAVNPDNGIYIYHDNSENTSIFDSFLMEKPIYELNIYRNAKVYRSIDFENYIHVFDAITARLRDKCIDYNKSFSIEKIVSTNTVYWQYVLALPDVNNTVFYNDEFITARKDINIIINTTPILAKSTINIKYLTQESLYRISKTKYLTNIDTIITSAPDKNIYIDNDLFGSIDNDDLYIYKDNSLNLKRYRLGVDIQESLIFTLREKYKLKFEEEGITSIIKTRGSLGEHNNFADVSFYRINYDMNRFYSDDNLKLYIKGLIRDEFLSFSNKTILYCTPIHNGFSITKVPKLANEYIFDAIIDFCKNYCNIITDSINDPLIPVSKVYGNALTNDIISFMKKYHKPDIETENIFNEKVQKPTWLEHNEEWLIKNQKSTATSSTEIKLLKLAFNTIVKNQTWLLKNPKPTFIDYFTYWTVKLAKDAYISHIIHSIKNKKDTMLDNILWLIKDAKYTQVDNSKFFDIIPKNTNLFKIIELSKDHHYGFISKDLWIEKVPKICYYKNAIRIDKSENSFEYQNDLSEITRIDKSIAYYYDFVAISNETLKELVYDDYDINTYKVAKDIIAQEVEVNNWAWVYEEEPFEPAYGIDELLLPENDIRYKDFEDIIWDRETCTPRFPIEEIDDYTFIAQFPNKYPMRDHNDNPLYEEVAKAYYGVKEENYYGIRLSIMRKVFLTYYTIWQNKIFEFAQMNMTQACNRMLDYLYNWILGYFSVEDIPHALRVFRQIRWYMETAIIQDSRYKITYIPNALTSGPLDTNEMPIENSLGINSTMYIDTNLHVIRSSPSFLGYDVWLEMYVFNKRTTSFSFSLATNTPVEVYLNDNLIDTINHTGVKYVYSLPYTAMKNTIKIFKSGANNTDNMFYIGNIVIPDTGKDGELSIEFDNSNKLGNKALNGVAQKVKAYTNLMSDPEFWEHLMKGNMALQDVYDKIQEYWNIHWRNQQKGKRLTIKRT